MVLSLNLGPHTLSKCPETPQPVPRLRLTGLPGSSETLGYLLVPHLCDADGRLQLFLMVLFLALVQFVQRSPVGKTAVCERQLESGSFSGRGLFMCPRPAARGWAARPSVLSWGLTGPKEDLIACVFLTKLGFFS